jgi:hypothetical protein
VTPSQLKSLYLLQANGNTETAFQYLCEDAARLFADHIHETTDGYHRTKNQAVMAPRPPAPEPIV